MYILLKTLLLKPLKCLNCISLRWALPSVPDSRPDCKVFADGQSHELCTAGNPIAAEDDYRLEVLIVLRRLERLDKEEFGEDERLEAEEVYEQRRQEQLAAEEVRSK